MAVITTMAMPPMLRAALRRIPLRKDEEIRLAREAIDEKGFVSNLERLLLAADESPVGRMAARLAGLLAGGQGMPITILKLEPQTLSQPAAAPVEKPEEEQVRAESDHRPQPKDGGVKEMTGARSITESPEQQAADPLAKAVKGGAKASAAKMIADEAEPDPRKVHLTTRIPADRPADLVKDEARKGYDLLFVGLEKSRDREGRFSAAVTEIVGGFDGPVALLSQADDGAEPPSLNRRSRILVPVNGSPTARRAAEVAFALARGTGARVTALFVTRDVSGIRTLKGREGVLKDIARLGERYDAEVRTIISTRAAAAEAVLKEGRTRHSMIVMGVTARPGEELFFGDTATQVLKSWKNPILLVAS
jgi:nucleotide-binding universal stress UspA family protein